MKASELRLGNLVEDDNSNTVEIQSETLPYLTDRYWLKGHYPISLTEEWLLRFGYKRMYS